ncbi:MAG: DUF4054 domain-containing protein [Myxococcales bacterium]|nr:DUF4054 domain-containing protein [Myxococcales bacterium]
MTATVEDLLAFEPTLSSAQTSVVAVVNTTDGLYQVQIEELAPASYPAAGASSSTIRDALLADLGAPGFTISALDLISPPTTAIKIVGLLGTPFVIGVASPAAGLEVTTTTADGVPIAVVDHYLALACRLVSAESRWLDLLTDGQALRALHLMSRAGVLERYEAGGDEGEAGPIVAEALGPASTSWAAMAQSAGDPSLTHTRWGRAFLELLASVWGQGSAVGAW